MPWHPRISEAEARVAIGEADSWAEVLYRLGYCYHGKNIAMLRKWAAQWQISTVHLSDRRGQRRSRTRYSDDELRDAVAASRSWAETLRALGYCSTGANWKTVKLRAAELRLSTSHFDRHAAIRERAKYIRTPLAEILVEGSTYSRANLKKRLYCEGLKERRCEECGQGEVWRDRRMSLILDHVNGVRDDNRIENLRIVCPNCAATLDTHCGRKNRIEVDPIECRRCSTQFVPRSRGQRYCSRECGQRWDRRGLPRPGARKAERPPLEQLRAEINAIGYSAVGRKYGVSDNAIRKWLRAGETRDREATGDSPRAGSRSGRAP